MTDERSQRAGGCLGRAFTWIGSIWLLLAIAARFASMSGFGPIEAFDVIGTSIVPPLIIIAIGRFFKRAGRSKDEEDVLGHAPPVPLEIQPPPPTRPIPQDPAPVQPRPPLTPVTPTPPPYTHADGLGAGDDDRFAEALAEELAPLESGELIEGVLDSDMSSRPMTSDEMIAEARRKLTGESDEP